VLARGGKPTAPPAEPPIPKPLVKLPEPKPMEKPVEKPVEKPAEKPPEEKPAPPKDLPPSEKILARIKDATEKRLTEEVMSRTEELMKALQKQDVKTVKTFLDEVAFGQLADTQILENFVKIHAEKTLESWEFQDIEIKMRIPMARPQPHALATMTYEFKFPKSTLRVQDQPIHWIKKQDGKWYVTKLPKTGK